MTQSERKGRWAIEYTALDGSTRHTPVFYCTIREVSFAAAHLNTSMPKLNAHPVKPGLLNAFLRKYWWPFRRWVTSKDLEKMAHQGRL